MSKARVSHFANMPPEMLIIRLNPLSIHLSHRNHFSLASLLSVTALEFSGQNAATGLHALIIAMQKQELCGVARYVYRRGTNPKMVALLPHIRNGYRCLVMVALPFTEDVR